MWKEFNDESKLFFKHSLLKYMFSCTSQIQVRLGGKKKEKKKKQSLKLSQRLIDNMISRVFLAKNINQVFSYKKLYMVGSVRNRITLRFQALQTVKKKVKS